MCKGTAISIAIKPTVLSRLWFFENATSGYQIGSLPSHPYQTRSVKRFPLEAARGHSIREPGAASADLYLKLRESVAGLINLK